MDTWTILIGVAVLVLLTQSWFWMLAFFLGGLAALFAIVASIIHFQILEAVGFFLLMCVSFACMVGVTNFRRDQVQTSNLSTAFRDIDR